MDRREYTTLLDILCCAKDFNRHLKKIETKLDILIGMKELENEGEQNEGKDVNCSRHTE